MGTNPEQLQPQGTKSLLERVKKLAKEAAPAVIFTATGATLGYVGAEVVREAALNGIFEIIKENPQLGDVYHLAWKVVSEKTEALPPLFAAVAGGISGLTALSLRDKTENPPSTATE